MSALPNFTFEYFIRIFTLRIQDIYVCIHTYIILDVIVFAYFRFFLPLTAFFIFIFLFVFTYPLLFLFFLFYFLL